MRYALLLSRKAAKGRPTRNGVKPASALFFKTPDGVIVLENSEPLAGPQRKASAVANRLPIRLRN